MNLKPRALFPPTKPYICISCALSLQLRARKYATAATSDIYDVVCVGGGPAGLSLLTALRMEKEFFNQAD